MIKVNKLSNEKPAEETPVEKPIEETIIEEVNLPNVEENIIDDLPCYEPEPQPQVQKKENPIFNGRSNYNNILFYGLGAALISKILL